MADAELIMSKIKMYMDHPVPGQPFADIFPIFRDPTATETLISNLVSHISTTHDLSKISSLVCLESRGFYFAPLIAARLALPCIPVRKGGKLPGEKVSVEYAKEYGPDVFEMKTDAFEGVATEGKRVILVDDLLGHGGSILAAKQLVEMLGMEVAECVFIFDVPMYYPINREKLGGLPRWAMVQLTEENLAAATKG